MKVSKLLHAATAGAFALFGAFGADAADKSVVVGYQTDALPSSVAIANGEFDKATGIKIDFRRFNSGAGDRRRSPPGHVQVGYVGSSPFAAATSRGLDVKAFYLASISGVDEALVVRNGSNINTLADLKGKKLAAAPVSTDHYQLLALIKSLGLNEKDVQVFAILQSVRRRLQPRRSRRRLCLGPGADRTQEERQSSRHFEGRGRKRRPTFSAWVATSASAGRSPGFPRLAGVVAKYRPSFADDTRRPGDRERKRQAACGPAGGTPVDQANGLKNLNLLPLKVQASDAWLGGGEKSGLAEILKNTAVFLKEQKKISDVLPSYAAFVTPDVVIAAEKGAGGS